MKWLTSVVTASFTFLFGEPNKTLMFLGILMALNLLFGVFTEKKKKLYAKYTTQRYIGYAGLVFLGHHLDQTGVMDSLGFDTSIRFLLIIYVLSKEIRRFLHYLNLLGTETPAFLDEGLQQLESKGQDLYSNLSGQVDEVSERIGKEYEDNRGERE